MTNSFLLTTDPENPEQVPVSAVHGEEKRNGHAEWARLPK